MNWGTISKYRNELFGVAIISIITLHYFEDVGGGKLYLSFIGAIGVDIFIFLSGMGLCFSMKKNSNIKDFYIRRIRRILPTYLLVAGLFYIYQDLIYEKQSIFKFLSDLLFITLFSEGNITFWFIGFIILMYIMYPLFFDTLSFNNKYRNIYFVGYMMLSIAFIILVKMIDVDFYNKIILLITRLPIFILGCYFGEKIYKELNFSLIEVVIIVVGVILEIYHGLTGIGPEFFIRLLFSIPLMLGIIYILKLIKSEKVNNILRIFGKYSLELYMLHIVYRMLLIDFHIKTTFLLYWSLAFIVLILSILVQKSLGVIRRR